LAQAIWLKAYEVSKLFTSWADYDKGLANDI